MTSLPTRTVAEICAALAQAETGDFDADNIPDYSTYLPLYIWSLLSKSCDLKKEVSNEHNKLVGQTAKAAEVNVLHLLSLVHGYGIETFKGRYTADNYGRKLKILVDEDGLKVYSIIREYDAKLGKEVVRSVLDRRYFNFLIAFACKSVSCINIADRINLPVFCNYNFLNVQCFISGEKLQIK